METYKLFIVLNNNMLVFDDVGKATIKTLQDWLIDEVNIMKPFMLTDHTQKYVISRSAVQYIRFEEMKSYEDRTNV